VVCNACQNEICVFYHGGNARPDSMGQTTAPSNRLIYIAFNLLNYYSSLMGLLKCDFGLRAPDPQNGSLSPGGFVFRTLSVTFAACWSCSKWSISFQRPLISRLLKPFLFKSNNRTEPNREPQIPHTCRAQCLTEYPKPKTQNHKASIQIRQQYCYFHVCPCVQCKP